MLSWKLRKPITGITRTSNLFRVDLALNLNHANKDSVSFEDAFTKTLRVIESRYMQCGETTNFSTRQELLKNIDVNIINWQEHFDRSADHKYAIYCDLLTLRYAPKKKFVRANLVPYMTKALRKAFMKRSELQSKYPTRRGILRLRNQVTKPS